MLALQMKYQEMGQFIQQTLIMNNHVLEPLSNYKQK
jgi:hypothetical protein